MRVIRDPGTRELSVRIGGLESVGQLLHDTAELFEVNATTNRESIRDMLHNISLLLSSKC